MVPSNTVTATMLYTLLVLTSVYGAPMKQSSKKKRVIEASIPPNAGVGHIQNLSTDGTQNSIDVVPRNVEPCALRNIPQLTQEQKDQIVRENDTIEAIKANPDSWISTQFIIINENQKQAILAHYRGLFRDVSKRPLLSVRGNSDSEDLQHVCPFRSGDIAPSLAINSDGNVVQVVQFPIENQVFIEERCYNTESNVIAAVKCQVKWNARQTAVVIDFATRTFGRQTIKVRSCVARI